MYSITFRCRIIRRWQSMAIRSMRSTSALDSIQKRKSFETISAFSQTSPVLDQLFVYDGLDTMISLRRLIQTLRVPKWSPIGCHRTVNYSHRRQSLHGIRHTEFSIRKYRKSLIFLNRAFGNRLSIPTTIERTRLHMWHSLCFPTMRRRSIVSTNSSIELSIIARRRWVVWERDDVASKLCGVRYFPIISRQSTSVTITIRNLLFD